ncbi:hypothetical protein TCAL_10315, partial [Tigriopus californicus]
LKCLASVGLPFPPPFLSRKITMADAKEPLQSVQVFGRKKTATAVAYCKRGKGLIKVNGRPLELVEPRALQYKLQEPMLLLGKDRFADVDIRIRVKGGGHTSQIYAIRQALSKSLVAYYQKFVDEQSKQEIKDILIQFDRTLMVADPRRCEAKKFGGPGARARYQKSYR